MGREALAVQCTAVQETWVQSLGQEDSLEEEMATLCSIFAWIPWREEPGRLQSRGSQRVRYDLATKQQRFFFFFYVEHFLKSVLNLLHYCFCFMFGFFMLSLTAPGILAP